MKHEYLDVALRIGRTLARNAIWSDSRCSWLTDAFELERGAAILTMRATGPDVYGGTSGIALFLSRLQKSAPDAVVEDAAHGALAAALSLVDAMRDGWSFYTGRAGVACVAIECGEALGDPRYVRRGLHLLRNEPPPSDAAPLDAVTGVAGCIAPLLRLWERYGDDSLLVSAIACGARLLTAVHRVHGEATWPVVTGARTLGYAHGTAGIALALLQLSQAVGDGDIREVAEEGFRYERARLDEAFAGGAAWCQGAAGIALSRLAALGEDPDASADVRRALDASAGALQPARLAGDFSLCHGAAGVAEAFLVAGEVLDESYRRTAEEIAAFGAKEYHRAGRGWPVGVRGGTHAPGLMLGLAGIGYFYLRMAVPQLAAPLLALPVPRGGSGLCT